MASNSIVMIGENTAEDFIDEGVSSLVYGIANQYWSTSLSSSASKSLLEIGKQAVLDALEGAEQVLRFSIMNSVITKVTTYAMNKLVISAGLFYTYVKSGGFLKKMKDKISGKSFKGKAGMYMMKTMIDTASGTEQERLKLVGMANDSVNNVTDIIAKERQTAVMQVTQQRNELMQTLGLSQKSKGLNDNKKLEAYYLKMKTGTWSIADRKLFYDCVPKQYLNGLQFNQSFLDKLNSYSEYAKTTENKLVNLAQTHLDLMTASNLSKVK